MATVLITGSNRGIGLEYCRQLQARGDTVVAVCRTPSPELGAWGCASSRASISPTRPPSPAWWNASAT